ncbi:MAG: nucleotidyltransferase family protein [Clostridia bacterium]|nr:nucleotidyltransferase family protein [Clostridia bacterium]
MMFIHLRRRGDMPPFAEGNGGVLERLVRGAEQASDGEEMFSLAATKKYTNARLRRAALFDLLSVTEEDVKRLPAYTVLLAASETGCAHLAAVKKSLPISLITKPSDERGLGEEARSMYRKAKEADRLYTLCRKDVPPSDTYLRCTPYIE